MGKFYLRDEDYIRKESNGNMRWEKKINHSFHGLVRKLDTWEREEKDPSKPEDRSTEISQVSHKELKKEWNLTDHPRALRQ